MKASEIVRDWFVEKEGNCGCYQCDTWVDMADNAMYTTEEVVEECICCVAKYLQQFFEDKERVS